MNKNTSCVTPLIRHADDGLTAAEQADLKRHLAEKLQELSAADTTFLQRARLHRLELRDPQVFLPRLAQVIDAIVNGKWWFDRDELRNRLPD